MMKKVLVLPLLLLAVAAAQELRGDSFAALKTPVVQVAPIAAVTVRPGKSATVRVDCRVRPGFHINSNETHNDLLKPTVLSFDPPTDLVIGKLTYPPGRDLTFEFLPNEKLNVYTGDFRVTALVKSMRSAAIGKYRVHGTLNYQACDNRQCYPPKELPVYFDVKVQKSSSKSHRHNPSQSPHVHK